MRRIPVLNRSTDIGGAPPSYSAQTITGLVTQPGTGDDPIGGVVHAVPGHVPDAARPAHPGAGCSRCATADTRATPVLALPTGRTMIRPRASKIRGENA